jgi:hypothetical protein
MHSAPKAAPVLNLVRPALAIVRSCARVTHGGHTMSGLKDWRSPSNLTSIQEGEFYHMIARWVSAMWYSLV